MWCSSQSRHWSKLRNRPHFSVRNWEINNGEIPLSGRGSRGKALEIIAEFKVGNATEFGLKVRKGDGEETVIGYNVAAGEVFIDRNKSGIVDFNPLFTNNRTSFPSRETAPLAVEHGNVVKLHIFVDWSSVEVFAGDGKRLITDQIFPSEDSQGVAVFANDGRATLKKLDIWQMKSIW